MDRYTVFKQTGTHADTLAAIGAADVLRQMDPRIVEFEDRFEVRLPRPMQRSDLDMVDPGFSFLQRANNPPPGLPPERIVRAGGAGEPRMYSVLARMKAYGGPNRFVIQFSKLKPKTRETKVYEGFCGSHEFLFSSPLVQLFNPQSAKGYALLKPSGTRRSDKTKDRWGEPFTEWLRYRGYFEGSAGWFTSGDLRLFTPIPCDIPQHRFSSVATAFRDLNLGGTAAKMDCRAVLGLTRLLVEQAETFRRPNQWLRGLHVTHYKDMGQAHTVMSMEQLALPDWGGLQTSAQAAWWLRTIEEHDVVLRRLTDSHSDEFALLKQYRHTLQRDRGGSTAAMLTFLSDYGTLLFRRRAADCWLLPPFTYPGVAQILSHDADMAAAIGNVGIVAVTAAVRRSTLEAQAARSRGRPGGREVRYGLLSDIRRAGLTGRQALLSLVSLFISEFNREGMRRRAGGTRSAHIRDGEYEEFVKAVDRLPSSSTAASLVCALACSTRNHAAIEAAPELAQTVSA